jgi:hypothetical protein
MKPALLALTILAFSTACSTSNDKSASTSSFSTPQPGGISPETAVFIAKGYMFLNYELADYDVVVTDEDGVYFVKFSSRREFDRGEGPAVYIRKSDGQRFRAVHSK